MTDRLRSPTPGGSRSSSTPSSSSGQSPHMQRKSGPQTTFPTQSPTRTSGFLSTPSRSGSQRTPPARGSLQGSQRISPLAVVLELDK
jgi:hypothetical protein